MNDTRRQLLDEYVEHRMQMGDIDSEDEHLSNDELRKRYYEYAQTLTNEQLIRICNSYAMAN